MFNMPYKMRKEMKILVVDDEELICWSLKRAFEKHAGHEVCCVHTGIDAIKKIMEGHYDVVITDLKLPDINGQDLVRKIKERYIDIPVIVISSYFTEDVLIDMMKQGAIRCINKPFQIEDVLNDVSNIASAVKAS